MNKSRRVASMGFRSLQNGEQGLTLVEVLVALGILAAVAVIFLLGMTTSSKAVMVSQERVAADSLAKSQMENIKSWAYDSDPNHNPPDYSAAKLADSPPFYINFVAERLEVKGGNPAGEDDGIQKITVTITRDGETVLKLEGYKVNR